MNSKVLKELELALGQFSSLNPLVGTCTEFSHKDAILWDKSNQYKQTNITAFEKDFSL